MGEVPFGSFVQLTYLGKKTTPRGLMHDVKVEFDPDDSVDVVQESLPLSDAEPAKTEVPF